jgi:simple sugar transport system ATP-binding protein/D-xylose transport system ATP-binding protein
MIETETTETKTEAVGSREPILELRGVSKSFGGVQALDDVDISVVPGEVLGLVGDNGAGKSTLVKTIAGNLKPDACEYRFDGETVEVHQPSDATELGIQTVYQDLALCDNLDAVQNLFLGREPTGFGGRIRRAEAEQRAREVLRRLRLDSIQLDRPVRAMSGGQRQNVAIARTLLYDPEVVILDEPTSALSLSAMEEVAELVRALADEGLAVIVVSHDIHKFVLEYTDRITVLRLGQNAGEFRTDEVTAEDVVNAMVGGESGVNSAR